VGLCIRLVLLLAGLPGLGSISWVRDLVLALVPLLFIYSPVLLCRWRASRGELLPPDPVTGKSEPVDSWSYRLSIPGFRDGASWKGALSLNLKVCALIAIPWVLGYHLYQTHLFGLSPGQGLRPDLAVLLLYHIFYVAIPEEFFYRGYFQTRLNEVFPRKWLIFGVPMGWGAIIAALMFAFGHSLVVLKWWHFATFFPGLIFAWMREKTDGVVAGALFHAICNVAVGLMDYHYGVVVLTTP
jgi:membrane protease YdiL (CAAX protease family)